MYRKYGSDLCRLCLQKEDELFYIFQRSERNCPTIAQAISDLFHVPVSIKDQYPKYICRECYTKVMGFYRMQANYPVHTLPTFVLFRNQCEIVNSTVDYAMRYNVSTPDLQHSPMSWEHSPFSLELEEIAAEDELRARRDAVDKLLVTVAQILKNIQSGAGLFDGHSSALEGRKLLALPDCAYNVQREDYSPVSSDPAPSPGEDYVLVLDDGDSSPPIRRPQRRYCRGQQEQVRREEGDGHSPLRSDQLRQKGDESDCGHSVEMVENSPRPMAPVSSDLGEDDCVLVPDDGDSSPPVQRPQRRYCKTPQKQKKGTEERGSPSETDQRQQKGDKLDCGDSVGMAENSPRPMAPVSSDLGEEDCVLVPDDGDSSPPVQRPQRHYCKTPQKQKKGTEERGSPSETDQRQQKGDKSPSSPGVGLRVGRKPRRASLKRIKYCESSDSDLEPIRPSKSVRQRVGGKEGGGGSFDCAICHSHHQSKEALRKHILQKHLSKDDWLRDCQDSDDSWAPNTLSEEAVSASESELSGESDDLAIDEPGTSGANECQYFRCAVCQKTFSRSNDLREHVSVAHLGGKQPQSRFKVQEKHSVRRRMMVLDSLMVDVEGEEGWKRCVGCGQRYTGVEDFLNHIRLRGLEGEEGNEMDASNASHDARGERESLEPTDEPADNGMSVELNSDDEVENGAKSFKCPFAGCKKTFKTHRGIMVHQTRSNHCPGERVKMPPKKSPGPSVTFPGRFKCCCCTKTFDAFYYLERHLRVSHSDERPFACDVCGAPFKLQKYLKKHMKLHTSQKTIECAECGQTFRELWCLRIHMQVHLTENTHTCPECGKGFRGRGRLMIHMKHHNDRSNYHKCSQCDSSFAIKQDLERHMSVHTRVRNFQCPICNKWYLHRRNLNQHMRSHNKEKKAKGRRGGKRKASETQSESD